LKKAVLTIGLALLLCVGSMVEELFHHQGPPPTTPNFTGLPQTPCFAVPIQYRDPCPDYPGTCVPAADLPALTPKQQRHRKIFQDCANKAYDHAVAKYKKDTGENNCNTCEAERFEAGHACEKYLTPEEIQCLNGTTIGVWAGDPFHCEDGATN
jgi:hypothetical protein